MSEILITLRKNNEPLTSLEIASRTNCSITSINTSLRRLKKDMSERLMSRLLTEEEKEKTYGHKVGCRINIFWLDE